MCARFLSHLLLLYIGRVHGTISGCTVLWEVHPASAQNKSLISDTDLPLESGNLQLEQTKFPVFSLCLVKISKFPVFSPEAPSLLIFQEIPDFWQCFTNLLDLLISLKIS